MFHNIWDVILPVDELIFFKMGTLHHQPVIHFPQLSQITRPIGSMYAIYGNIYHQYTPNVSIYTIHGSYGRGYHQAELTSEIPPSSRQGVVQLGPAASARAAQPADDLGALRSVGGMIKTSVG